MGILKDIIIGSFIGGALGSKKGGVLGALLQKNGSFTGAVVGGLMGSLLEKNKNEGKEPKFTKMTDTGDVQAK